MNSSILVLNAGSSSLKFKLFQRLTDDLSLRVLATGLCERIGDPSASEITLTNDTDRQHLSTPLNDHFDAMFSALDLLHSKFGQSLTSDIKLIGHRVAHGLHISQPSIINDQILSIIKEGSTLAPLHNPANLNGILAAQKAFPNALHHVAVFDTAFHQTMPPRAYTYAIPKELRIERMAVRRYGFHGTSHHYLAQRASSVLGIPVDQINLISCHLGAGASVCSIKNGKSVFTSMGLTPLEGLVMSTRPGDIDAGILLALLKQGMSVEELETILNKKSGLAGMAGVPGGDFRAVLDKIQNRGRDGCGDDAKLALDVFVYRLQRYIAASLLDLDGKVDAIVFSAGIGEHSPLLRKLTCDGFRWAGVKVDDERNEESSSGSGGMVMSEDGSRVKVLAIPADEELAIAQQTLQVASRRL